MIRRPSTAPVSAVPSLARDSGRALAGSVVSNVSNVVVVIALARFLGGEAVGQYTVAFALRAILILVCGLGMRASMTRFVAAYSARGDYGGVRGAVSLGLWVPLGVSSLVAGVWFASAGPLATTVFEDPALVAPMRLFALSLPFAVLLDNALAATQGFLTMRAYTWIGQILEPGWRLIVTVVLLATGGDVATASVAVPVASVVAASAAVVALGRLLAGHPPARSHRPWRELASFSALSWVASMATQGLLWADILILGVLVSTAEVGDYQVAARVVLIATFAITPLTASMAGRIAYLWEHGDAAGVTERYVAIVLWCSRLSFPVLAGVMAVPAVVLGIFGEEFTTGTSVVLILAVGAVAEAIGAPSSVLLNQIGRNRLNMTFNLGALALNIALNLLLVPRMGIDGAAVAWAVTFVAGGTVRIIAVRRIATSRWPWGRQLFVAGASALVALLAARLVTDRLPEAAVARFLVAALVIAVCYAVGVWRWGLDRAERDQAVRAVTLRMPGLRRGVNRWRLRGSRTSDQDLHLPSLISPFRGDVLARMELFRTAREHAQLRDRDFSAFVDLLRGGAYGAWFEEILVGRRGVGGSTEESRQRTFVSIVESSLQVLDRFERSGAASFDPVTVTRVAAGTAVEGWTLGEDRWVLLDGGHRVALMLLDGETTLPGSAYVEVDGVPPNNTAVLLRAGRLEPAATIGFLATGLVERPGEVRSWEDLLARVSPADREQLERWPDAALLDSARAG